MRERESQKAILPNKSLVEDPEGKIPLLSQSSSLLTRTFRNDFCSQQDNFPHKSKKKFGLCPDLISETIFFGPASPAVQEGRWERGW
ncbi:hypothetical protein TNCV_2007361 [Trichonephila clavipes]|nr:hypothetical protein TNCV_2007361 [Trichonephila clavipes]